MPIIIVIEILYNHGITVLVKDFATILLTKFLVYGIDFLGAELIKNGNYN